MSFFVSRGASNAARQAQYAAASRVMARPSKGWSTTGKILTGTVAVGAALHATPLLEQWFGKWGVMRTHKYTEKVKDLFNGIDGVVKKEKGNGFFAFCKSIPEAMKNVFYPHKWFQEKSIDLKGDGGKELKEMEDKILAEKKTLPDR